MSDIRQSIEGRNSETAGGLRALTLLVVASVSWTAIGLVTGAFAQTEPGPVTSPIRPSTPPPPPSGEVTAPSELGITVGSFRLFPTLDLRAGYDTNVFAQPSNQTGSAYEAIRPSLDLRSDWNNHMLNFGAYGVFGFYNNANSLNYQNFGVSTDGRLDIMRDWYVTGSAAFTRTIENFGAPDVTGAISPSAVYALPLNLSMFQRFNRLYYQVTAGATGYRYQDYSQIAFNTLPAGSRDRNEYGESLRVGYEFFEGVDFWAQGNLNQRSYQQYINTFGQARDSNGWGVTGGSTVELSKVSKLEGFVGYTQQNYTTLPTTSAVNFGLQGTWNGYQPLVVRPFVVRTINETGYINYQDYISTVLGAEINYTIQEGWQLNVGGSVSFLDYSPIPGAPNVFQHTDNYYTASVGLLYSIRPEIQIGPLYEFIAGYGPDPNTSPNYNRHVILLRLVAKR